MASVESPPATALKRPGALKRPREEGRTLTWDEEGIAEHDKTRGTRTRIEEPKTPWHGSPASSDLEDEGDEGSNAPGHEAEACATPQPSPEPAQRGGFVFPASLQAADPEEVAARLTKLAKELENQPASPDSASSPAPTAAASAVSAAPSPAVERQLTWGDGSSQPSKPASSRFLEKRKQHYQEMAIALGRKPASASSATSPASEGCNSSPPAKRARVQFDAGTNGPASSRTAAEVTEFREKRKQHYLNEYVAAKKISKVASESDEENQKS